MSFADEFTFLYDAGMTEDDILAQVLDMSLQTFGVDTEQNIERSNLERGEEKLIEEEKEATRRILRDEQNRAFMDSLTIDREKEKEKERKEFAKELEKDIEDDYDYDYDEPDEDIPTTLEDLRNARLKRFTK
jgi:hypothetical protein